MNADFSFFGRLLEFFEHSLPTGGIEDEERLSEEVGVVYESPVAAIQREVPIVAQDEIAFERDDDFPVLNVVVEHG